MPNVNFNPGTETFDLTPGPEAKTPASSEKDISAVLSEREEKWAARLEQQQAAANRRFSELYEQQQIQSRAMMDLLKARNPDPDYSSNDAYFQDSYSATSTTPPALSSEDVKRLAAEAARATFQETVTEGTKRQKQIQTREQELADYFNDKCHDLHHCRQAVLDKYQQAKENFPAASTDDHFAWALETVRGVIKTIAPASTKQQPHPVGSGGTSRNTQRDTQSDQHREMLRKSDEEVMRDYYQEAVETEQELERVFDQW